MIQKTRSAPAILAALLLAIAGLAVPCLAAAEMAEAHAVQAAQADNAAIDINRAGVAELQSIKGIGPALAKRIVEYRDAEGPFTKVEDLLQVKGVGPKLLDRIRTKVVVKEAPAKKG